VIETNGQALVEFLKMQTGTVHVCMEAGTQSGWLSEILSPHAARVVVTHVQETRGQKSDEHDAFGLADQLRTGAIQTTVFKSVGAFATLRQLVKAHAVIVRDTVRVQMRIKAIFRWVQGPQGKWERAQVQQTRGLNHRHNSLLKLVFFFSANHGDLSGREELREPLFRATFHERFAKTSGNSQIDATQCNARERRVTVREATGRQRGARPARPALPVCSPHATPRTGRLLSELPLRDLTVVGCPPATKPATKP